MDQSRESSRRAVRSLTTRFPSWRLGLGACLVALALTGCSATVITGPGDVDSEEGPQEEPTDGGFRPDGGIPVSG